MILFRGPRLLLCGPYYTVAIVLYDGSIEFQVNGMLEGHITVGQSQQIESLVLSNLIALIFIVILSDHLFE